MRKFLFVLIVALLLPKLSFAEIKINRDPFGNIASKWSWNTLPYNEQFNLRIGFTGKSIEGYFREGKKTIKQTVPTFSLAIYFECKIKDSKLIEQMKPIKFLDRSFAYITSEMDKPLVSIASANIFQQSSQGYVHYVKSNGEYNVYVDDTTASVHQKKIPAYHAPQITISYNGDAPSDPQKINFLDKISFYNDPVFAAWIFRALVYNHAIIISIPYSESEYKEFDNYTQEELSNLPSIIINIPIEVVAEWQKVANFAMPKPPKK